MTNTPLNHWFYQAEDYFFRSLSTEYLDFCEIATAYSTGVNSPHLNPLSIRGNIAAFADVLYQSRAFYSSKQLPWIVVISEKTKSPALEAILCGIGLRLSEESISMYCELSNDILPSGNKCFSIRVTNNKLGQWMTPLISAFESPLEVTELYIEAHHRALTRTAGFRHSTLYENESPVSSLTLSIHKSMARLDDVGTAQNYRNKGYATSLILRALLDAKNCGATHCFLEASDSGLPLYKRIGFKPLFKNFIYSSQGH